MRLISLLVLLLAPAGLTQESARPRAREAGIVTGALPPGPLNAITDVAGVRVGHTTVVDGKRLNTGITAVLPHGGDLFRQRVPAAVHVGNGFGKLIGALQVQELGELETPILLTGTLNVWRVADGLVTTMLEKKGMEAVRSINPLVGETNDGRLSDIRSRPLGEKDVRAALKAARAGRVEEGAVGAGSGTICFGYKGGIGTSSRKVGEWTVGVLVQTNFGGDLHIAGQPVGRRLRAMRKAEKERGSCMVIIATDAPLTPRNLERLAKRAPLGIARTGGFMSNGSGDFIVAFSTAKDVRRTAGVMAPGTTRELPNAAMSGLFQGCVEATEEAILNSLFKARTTTGMGRTVEALPIDRVLEMVKKR